MKFFNRSLLVLSFCLLVTSSAIAQLQARISCVEITTDDYTRAKEYKHDINGVWIDGNGNKFVRTHDNQYPPRTLVNYKGSEVNEIISELADMIKNKFNHSEVTYAEATSEISVAKRLGVDKYAMMNKLMGPGQAISAMDYFPIVDIKDNLVEGVTNYYSVKFEFVRGMSQGPMIVMDQEKPGWIKFNIKTTITCFDDGGAELWIKESTTLDFSSLIEGTLKKKHFKYTDDQYLTKDIIRRCVGLALANTIQVPNK